MMKVHFHLEDTEVLAVAQGDGTWLADVYDHFKEVKETICMTSLQLAAIAALAIGGEEDMTGELNRALRAEAEEVTAICSIQVIP